MLTGRLPVMTQELPSTWGLWQPGAGFRPERHRPASVEIVDRH